jgi:hypothetical protein
MNPNKFVYFWKLPVGKSFQNWSSYGRLFHQFFFSSAMFGLTQLNHLLTVSFLELTKHIWELVNHHRDSLSWSGMKSKMNTTLSPAFRPSSKPAENP